MPDPRPRPDSLQWRHFQDPSTPGNYARFMAADANFPLSWRGAAWKQLANELQSFRNRLSTAHTGRGDTGAAAGGAAVTEVGISDLDLRALRAVDYAGDRGLFPMYGRSASTTSVDREPVLLRQTLTCGIRTCKEQSHAIRFSTLHRTGSTY